MTEPPDGTWGPQTVTKLETPLDREHLAERVYNEWRRSRPHIPESDPIGYSELARKAVDVVVDAYEAQADAILSRPRSTSESPNSIVSQAAHMTTLARQAIDRSIEALQVEQEHLGKVEDTLDRIEDRAMITEDLLGAIMNAPLHPLPENRVAIIVNDQLRIAIRQAKQAAGYPHNEGPI